MKRRGSWIWHEALLGISRPGSGAPVEVHGHGPDGKVACRLRITDRGLDVYLPGKKRPVRTWSWEAFTAEVTRGVQGE